jgi:hypothetical protein
MIGMFFRIAASSPGRQAAFRNTVFAHALALLGGAWLALARDWNAPRGHAHPAVLLGHLLLVAGILEGALLIGWRLTQLPKSQALEFLLVSQLPPWNLLLAEGIVGLARLALVTLSGLPVLVFFFVSGRIDLPDLVVLLLMPFTWGAVTGLGLTAWAYEPIRVRRAAEVVLVLAILVYLVVGVLAAEKIVVWITTLPDGFARGTLWAFTAFHLFNPFGIMEFWLREDHLVAEDRFWGLQLVATTLVLAGLIRAAIRLKAHFHELHYRPVEDFERSRRDSPGDAPLAWWAVRRVSRYSGRFNLWLAWLFGFLYAAFVVGEPHWPSWLGRRAFDIFEQLGGIPGIATAMVVLAAVPAAFQYGLWDSNAQDRCRRLELLLLTDLDARDYCRAALAAAWQRGRGYFAVALMLWTAALIAGRISGTQFAASVLASLTLGMLYFSLGFRAFTRGNQANGLGTLLTVGVPLLTYALFHTPWWFVATLLPPGSVYAPTAGLPPWTWIAGPLLAVTAALAVARSSLRDCDRQLRLWYERHHGRKVLE